MRYTMLILTIFSTMVFLGFAESLEDKLLSRKDVIIEGVGWKDFKVGETKEALQKYLGKMDENSEPTWYRWSAKHIHCAADDFKGAIELRFDLGFPYPLTTGILMGSSESEILKIYGEPDYEWINQKSKKFQYSKKGLLLWTSNGSVNQIVIFKPFNFKK